MSPAQPLSNAQHRAARIAPAPSADPVAISIFDLDRTLTRLPTYSPFLLFAARRRAPWRLLLIPVVVLLMLAHVAKLMPRKRLKPAMHRLMVGGRLKERDAARLADDFARQLMAHGIYGEAIDLIAAERIAGRRVVMATAAPHFYASALARHLGISDVIATASCWHDGHLLPDMVGDNCYGPVKCAMVRAWLAERSIDRLRAHIRFFSDHASDIATFDYCDEPVAVNPSTKLQKIAQDRSWPVMEWRKGRKAPAPA